MVSFIIPTYNRAKTINVSIQSVVAQTEREWQLIIVDDGSKDNTKEIVTPYLKDSRIEYIYQENNGVSAARNKGAQQARGEYLIFLDSDDSINPNLVEFLNKKNYSDYDIIFWHIKKVVDGEPEILTPKNMGYLYKDMKVQFLAGSVCYRKEIFEKVGGYDTEMSFGENYELGMRICQIDKLRTLYINEVLATYYIITSKRTSNAISNKLPSLIHQYRKHRDFINSSRFEKSKMYYFFAYLLEKSNKIKMARRFYAASWKAAPWRPKPFLKLVLLFLFK